MKTAVRLLRVLLPALIPAAALASIPSDAVPTVIVSTAREPVAAGPFAPTWDSLRGYEAPAWFRDAKFGIWAHWGPQCEPGMGDWYARHLYFENGPAWGPNVTAFHRETYGHPSQAGFKEVIHRWQAENWDPDKLVALYKRAGAEYFFALANHHDNLDLWDSKYQPWNSVRVGPKKDLIAGWAKAARAQGLKFGVSIHAAHAWSWYEPAQGADTQGPLAGVPYDGKLTAADGKGTWWDGLDPQDLYEQRHAPAPDFLKPLAIHERWDWGNGITAPDLAYCEKFYNRTMDLINRVEPDLVYFDDTALPLWPVSDAGLKIAAHYYNQSAARHGGRAEVVIFGKVLTPDQKRALVWDVERGAPNAIQALPWQTCTCIGSWHYEKRLAEENRYKSASTVIQMLADIVSKNGNLLLNIPLRGDGTPDDQSLAVVEGIAAWMEVNRSAIFGTRPWQLFGEGPAAAGAELTGQGFNEGKGKPYTADDVRFTQSPDGRTLYVIGLVRPTQPVAVPALGTAAGRLDRAIAGVVLLGSAVPVKWTQTAAALVLDAGAPAGPATPVVFKVSLR
ncbi:Alpha-L-fucosidase [Lacunisphaera limnophila]|uniref:alpha-L-fucosidase n=1 Tax=Lacunisphaera limnophila TaxID=1838286 RepID=A0A1D8ATN2_9BACT|nr:alpha-L-fucosidase [Lacunisphaera limnophila]AOS44251.1 Alpha-L-fucosidase [Lacunisphaera limnophila]